MASNVQLFHCMNISLIKSRYKKSNEWKLNELILEEERVDSEIKKKCSFIPMLIRKHGNEWYEFFINDVIKFLKSEARRLNSVRKLYINNLFDILNVIDINNDNLRSEIKTKIEKYYEEERLGIEKRACEAKRNIIYQPTKVLIEKELKKSEKNSINKFQTEKEILTDKDKIMSEVSNFYKDLLSTERVSKSLIENYKFSIKPFNLVENKFDIGYKITFAEAEEVVLKMKNSSPVPNGLTIGFYKKKFKYFGHYFVDILNDHTGKLSNTYYESKIKLIPKKKKDIKGINDLRPITLTNLEYRIFTKIISNRFRMISHRFLEDHQTCSIKDRRMNDNILLLRDLIEDSNKDLNIISVDQKKAFDSVSHRYLFALLRHLNIGEFMLNNIIRIYQRAYAKIIMNKIESDPFSIISGIKQGCALSMILYILLIEELMLRIKNNQNIRGYKLYVLNEREIKCTAYADDIGGYLADHLSISLFFQEFDDPIELIKRDTLILPFEEGGMNMFNLYGRLKTIHMQSFFYIAKNHQRDFFQISIFWLKFYLRDIGLRNFNLIPYGGDINIPKYYEYMIECVNEFKSYDRLFLQKRTSFTSKNIYKIFRKKYEKRSKIESEYRDIDWKNVYNTINSKSLNSELR
ncbi:unnamed protein product, partial [Brachionus calyciflorus]